MANEDIKAAIKEATDEWLEKKFAAIGKWTVGSLSAIVLAGLIYIAVKFGS
jgi:hypothetical protein